MKKPLEYQTVATIDAFFQATEPIDAQFQSSMTPIDANFGVIYSVNGGKVLYASTATWNEQRDLVAKEGYIYIYSDYKKNNQNQNIAGYKVGDGTTYLIDLPFTDSLLYDHVNDMTRHITQNEREFWNNKVRCYIGDDSENLIFTKE